MGNLLLTVLLAAGLGMGILGVSLCLLQKKDEGEDALDLEEQRIYLQNWRNKRLSRSDQKRT